jgi:hypothetical protein
MNARHRVILSGVLVSTGLWVVGCTRAQLVSAGRCPSCPVVVSIFTDQADCDVDAPMVNVRKHLHDSVQWVSVDSKPYVVQFRASTGAPKSDDQLQVPTSGPLTITGPEEGYYEYDIYAGTIGHLGPDPCNIDDPGVRIKP